MYVGIFNEHWTFKHVLFCAKASEISSMDHDTRSKYHHYTECWLKGILIELLMRYKAFVMGLLGLWRFWIIKRPLGGTDFGAALQFLRKRNVTGGLNHQLEVFSGWHWGAARLSSLSRIRHNGTSLQGWGSDTVTPPRPRALGAIRGRGRFVTLSRAVGDSQQMSTTLEFGIGLVRIQDVMKKNHRSRFKLLFNWYLSPSSHFQMFLDRDVKFWGTKCFQICEVWKKMWSYAFTRQRSVVVDEEERECWVARLSKLMCSCQLPLRSRDWCLSWKVCDGQI